ncbi:MULTISPECIES: hypothetical protein [Eikenella]|uniref:Major facilitator superfamily (MFS) profile domain-containing protein n=1 Tax=Eikenella exigua TaxID=2528037 RepID=A0AAX1F6R8_9NEIS|nr:MULTISPECIES: hypothetical protein [Eikenella]OAM28944.1 hypothetical protein A7P94_02780 [Eikenella sp. NML01-A-086]OAM40930.1 hypothetical protein A7Q02_06180 [Eikenella sp. NML97-A-109]QED91798.1 hypothetical protein EZJ17_03500 [Eikenella exigua]
MQLNFGIFVLQAVIMEIFASLSIVVGETCNRLKQVFVASIMLIAAVLCGIYADQALLLAIGVSLVVYFVGFNILGVSLLSIVSKVAPMDLRDIATCTTWRNPSACAIWRPLYGRAAKSALGRFAAV